MNSSGVKLRLLDPLDSAPKENAALGQRPIEDQIPERAQLIESGKRIAQLGRNNAELEAQFPEENAAVASVSAAGPGKVNHIAHADGWIAICTAPDFCKVGNAVVAFNSFATLDQHKTASINVQARGTPVYRKGDIFKRVRGDAGKHIVSNTSLGTGHVRILDGHDNVKVNGIPVACHDSRCLINCDASGVGGAQGKLVTERKSVSSESTSKDAAPPGQRTSEKLAALETVRASVATGVLDLDALDEYVDFDQSSQVLNDLIAQIRGPRGTALGYAAEVSRGLLGFGKDVVMGAGEMAYEGIKSVPKLVQLSQTERGKILAHLDAKIVGENIRLGNITPGTVGRGALDIGKAILKPVTDPWGKGEYVESITRGAAEIATIATGWIKANKFVKGIKTANYTKSVSAKAATGGNQATVANGIVRTETRGDHHNDGVHIAGAKNRVATNPDTAFFWSGRSSDASGNKIGGAERAAEIAHESKGTTLESLIRERKIDMPIYDPKNPAVVKMWEDISAEYAAGVSGNVTAVLGSELRPGSIWITKELPALLNNPNVSRITTVDPLTGVKTVIFP